MAGLRIAVFASGQGTNFQALADAAHQGRLDGASLELLVCDKPDTVFRPGVMRVLVQRLRTANEALPGQRIDI